MLFMGSSVASSQSGVLDIDELLKQEGSQAETANVTDKAKASVVQPESREEKAIPYYTIPAGSDLVDTTLYLRLIGEVPVEGKLMQPLFPFSAIVKSRRFDGFQWYSPTSGYNRHEDQRVCHRRGFLSG